jgi:hypothetical protein
LGTLCTFCTFFFSVSTTWIRVITLCNIGLCFFSLPVFFLASLGGGGFNFLSVSTHTGVALYYVLYDVMWAGRV